MASDMEAGGAGRKLPWWSFALAGYVVARDRKALFQALRAPPATGAALETVPADEPAAPPRRSAFAIAKIFIARIGDNNLSLVAAGVAFYAMFGLFPGLAALVSLYGLVGDTSVVQTQVSELTNVVPPEAAKLLNDYLNSLLARPASHLNTALVIAVALALWGARAGTSALMAGLNIAFDERETRNIIKQQFVAIGLTLAGLVFAIIAMTAIAGVPIALAYLPLTETARNWLALARWPLLLLFVLLAFSICYRFGPSRSLPRWRVMSTGSIAAALLWLVGSVAFSTYVGRFGSYDATYGSLGAVVVLLLWFWLSALLVLCGAALNAVIEDGGRQP